MAGLLALGGSAAAIYAVLPFPEVPAVGPKYRYFAEHRDEFDIVFLGSSRFYHHVLPLQFDAELAEQTGQRMRSFNASYDAVWPPESYYYLRQLLALKPAKLRWVFIDAMDINPDLDEGDSPTRRQVYWHDWRHTEMALAGIAYSSKPEQVRFGLAARHLQLWAQNSFNIGRGMEWLTSRLEMPRAKTQRPPVWLEAAGFHEGGTTSLQGEERVNFLKKVTSLRNHFPVSPASPALAKAMKEIALEVRAAGAEPVFVLAPSLNEKENLSEAPEHAALLRLNSPKDCPVLYDPDLHYDGWHLNDRGAVDFTRLLVERFAPLVGGAAGKR